MLRTKQVRLAVTMEKNRLQIVQWNWKTLQGPEALSGSHCPSLQLLLFVQHKLKLRHLSLHYGHTLLSLGNHNLHVRFSRIRVLFSTVYLGL